MKIDKYALKIFIQNRILNHVLFWAFSYYILLNIFSKNVSYKTIDFLYTGIFIFTLIIPVLLNLYLLFPQFLLRKKYLFYAICIILCLFGFSYFNYLLFDKLIDHLILV